MGWLTVFKLALSLANLAAQYLHDQGIRDDEDAKWSAAQLAQIADRVGIAKQVEAETAKMSAGQVVDDLAKHGELRD